MWKVALTPVIRTDSLSLAACIRSEGPGTLCPEHSEIMGTNQGWGHWEKPEA